ncbi:hypothetical protein KJA13_01540 [Patescibacteria group bacterium]|nr:hypothetical protein [Patescibacteria group bacterium]
MDKKEIIQEVKEQIKLEYIKYLVWYGNLRGNDINVMAVIDKRARVRLYKLPKSKLDILTIGKDEFRRRLRMLDPAITEPLITGFRLLGDEREFSLLRSKTFLSLPLSNKALQFLKEKARERLGNAKELLQASGQEDEDNLLPCLVNLSWACSYFGFAEYYGDSPEFVPITFAHLLAQDGEFVLGEVMGVLKAVKSGREFNKDQAVDLFKRTQKMLR